MIQKWEINSISFRIINRSILLLIMAQIAGNSNKKSEKTFERKANHAGHD